MVENNWLGDKTGRAFLRRQKMLRAKKKY